MKTIGKIKVGMLLMAAIAMGSCKDQPNATQETDGQVKHGATTEEIDSSSVADPGETPASSTPNDLEGSNSSNTN